MSGSIIKKNYLKHLIISLPQPRGSEEFPKLADAVNLAIQSAKSSAESALLLVELSKEMPEISTQTRLAARIAGDAATYAASVASVCIDCISKSRDGSCTAFEPSRKEGLTLEA